MVRARIFRAILLVTIFGIAIALRFGLYDIIEFEYDQHLMLSLASSIVDHHQWLLLGQLSSKGLHNAPLIYYLLAIPYRLTTDPLWITRGVALINVVAIYVTYRYAARYLSSHAGLVVAALYATSPWAVYFSRKLWNPTVQPPLMALLLYAVTALVVERRSSMIGFVIAGFAVAGQIHPLAYLLGFPLLAILLLYRPPISWPSAFLGTLVAAALFVPYLWALHAKSGLVGLADTLLARAGGALGGAESTVWMKLLYGFYLLSGLDLGHLFGESLYYLEYRQGLGLVGLKLLFWLTVIGLAVGVATAGWEGLRSLVAGARFRERRDVVGGILFLWFTLPLAAMLPVRFQFPPYYYIFLYPVPFLLFGLAWDRWAIVWREGKVALAWRHLWLGAGLALLIIGQIWFLTDVGKFLNERGGASGEYGIIYRHKLAMADYLVEKAGGAAVAVKNIHQEKKWCEVCSEIHWLVRQKAGLPPAGRLPTPSLRTFYFIETLDRPLSPEALARLRPVRQFGPILLYTKEQW